MKFILLACTLLLSSCSIGGLLLPLPSNDQQFQCDMDPNRTRCGSFQELHGLDRRN